MINKRSNDCFAQLGILQNPSRLTFLFLFILGAALICIAPVHADNDSLPKSNVLISRTLAPVEEGMSRKTLRGKIGAKNLNGVAIIYEETETSSKEMWMPFESETYLDQYNDVNSITEGDQVTVTYDEDPQGTGKRMLRGITLVRKPPVEIEEYDPDAEAAE